MKILIRPILDPQREIDLTHRLVSAIAEELWRLFGGNETLNWIEAEWHLQRIVAQSRATARETVMAHIAPARADEAIRRTAHPVRRVRETARLPKRPGLRNGVRRAKEQRAAARPPTWNAPQIAGAAMANA